VTGLLIDHSVKAAIADAIATAPTVSRDMIEKISRMATLTPGEGIRWEDRPPVVLGRPVSSRVRIPSRVGNFIATFSYEDQPVGMVAHLSISIDDERAPPDAVPGPLVLEQISRAFDCWPPDQIFLEEFLPGRSCVNVLHIVRPPAGAVLS
jgi:hypothetical protein